MDCPNCDTNFEGLIDGEVYKCTKCGSVFCEDCILKHLHDEHFFIQAGKIRMDKFEPVEGDKWY